MLVEVNKKSVRYSTCRVSIGFGSGTVFLTLMDFRVSVKNTVPESKPYEQRV